MLRQDTSESATERITPGGLHVARVRFDPAVYDLADISQEAVATAWDRLDEPRLGGALSQSLAQKRNVLGRLTSSTNVSGESSFMSASLSRALPLFRTKRSKVSKTLGVEGRPLHFAEAGAPLRATGFFNASSCRGRGLVVCRDARLTVFQCVPSGLIIRSGLVPVPAGAAFRVLPRRFFPGHSSERFAAARSGGARQHQSCLAALQRLVLRQSNRCGK